MFLSPDHSKKTKEKKRKENLHSSQDYVPKPCLSYPLIWPGYPGPSYLSHFEEHTDSSSKILGKVMKMTWQRNTHTYMYVQYVEIKGGFFLTNTVKYDSSTSFSFKPN
jgi:hypothetical protein